MKKCSSVLADPLRIIFCMSVEKGSLPQEWKQANVTPVYKKG